MASKKTVKPNSEPYFKALADLICEKSRRALYEQAMGFRKDINDGEGKVNRAFRIGLEELVSIVMDDYNSMLYYHLHDDIIDQLCPRSLSKLKKKFIAVGIVLESSGMLYFAEAKAAVWDDLYDY